MEAVGGGPEVGRVGVVRSSSGPGLVEEPGD